MPDQTDSPDPVETTETTAAPAAVKPEKPRARLADDGSPLPKGDGTRPIASPLPAGAAAALGGPPVPVPVARARTAERPMAAAAARAEALGNPSFDPPSPETVATRQAIEEVKASCRSLIAAIRRTRETVLPLLQTLAKRARDVKTREDFDPAEVERFLQDCDAAIEKLKKG